MSEFQMPSETDILRCAMYLIDAIDPRISVSERNKFLESAEGICPELILPILGGMTSGIIGQFSIMVVGEKNQSEFLDKYLAGLRINTGSAEITFLGDEQ